jgi:excinuclease ABC subunit A
LAQDGNASLTAKYLRGELVVAETRELRPIRSDRMLKFLGVHLHNLKNVSVEIPLGCMVVVTGVSGSGKSTLVHDVIYRALTRTSDAASRDAAEGEAEPAHPVHCRSTENTELVREVVMIDQSPIGRTPRSNPVTYIKAFDIMRGLFAATKDAEKRGYTAGHFSFNVPGGRCEVCQGDGTVSVEMQFLADVELVCEECRGTRFKTGIMEVRYKGKNIHEVLQLTVREAVAFFRDTARLANKLQVLVDVGLGYLRLGQSATTLSGGEAQRVKLASRLAEASSSGTLFLFDEPTTGLHFDDIAKLLFAFERLIRNGGSLLIIEHNMDVIRAADWIIDMGPEGGEGGGEVVAVGRPDDIAREPRSHTGYYLRESGNRVN